MSTTLFSELFQELDAIPLIDPHTHIEPKSAASKNLVDLLGYHYYTELAHSAGLEKSQIEDPKLDPKEKVHLLIRGLGAIHNTVQWSWMIELCQKLLGFRDEQIDESNWESLYDLALTKMSQADWEQQVFQKCGIESVFLTNDFDDPLEGFDTRRFVPCLRTDDLVFHFAKTTTRERLTRATQVELLKLSDLHSAIGKLFEHFLANGARACAISLPPYFAPVPIGEAAAEKAFSNILRFQHNSESDDRLTMAYWVFWTLAEYCSQHRLPFDLMIGVNRQVYPSGVYQGQDLYDSRVSMIQYAPLFNAFPKVTFPISVLASVTNQELVDYAWIFPNVVTNGHWWYSNTPSFIYRDLAARLEAIPSTKQIGYYSDAYKLEFALPKFSMYKRTLAKVLAHEFVIDRGWSQSRAIELGKQILRGNVERIFGR